jgi:hypothetical protein
VGPKVGVDALMKKLLASDRPVTVLITVLRKLLLQFVKLRWGTRVDS